MVANHRGGGDSSVIVTRLQFLTTWTLAMTALWINNPGFDTDHRHRGGMLTKTQPPTELQIGHPAPRGRTAPIFQGTQLDPDI